AAASGLFALVFVVGIVVGPTAGRASDRYSRTGTVLACLVCGVAGVGGLLGLSGLPALGASVVVAAAGLTALFPVMQAFLLDRFPDGSTGGDLGAVKAVYTGVGALGPTFVGVVAGRASYAAGFAVLGGLLVVGLALTVRLHLHER
ncbi:MAG: MFS transporter, partial [Haloferacaceae archaeon]